MRWWRRRQLTPREWMDRYGEIQAADMTPAGGERPPIGEGVFASMEPSVPDPGPGQTNELPGVAFASMTPLAVVIPVVDSLTAADLMRQIAKAAGCNCTPVWCTWAVGDRAVTIGATTLAPGYAMQAEVHAPWCPLTGDADG